MEEIRAKYIDNCARCGDDHADVVFKKLRRPIEDADGNTLYTHWAPCPYTCEPILMRVIVEEGEGCSGW